MSETETAIDRERVDVVMALTRLEDALRRTPFGRRVGLCIFAADAILRVAFKSDSPESRRYLVDYLSAEIRRSLAEIEPPHGIIKRGAGMAEERQGGPNPLSPGEYVSPVKDRPADGVAHPVKARRREPSPPPRVPLEVQTPEDGLRLRTRTK